MTVAGIGVLVISKRGLRETRDPLDGKGQPRCGETEDDTPLGKAMAWLNQHFQIDLSAHTYYNLYGLERAGRLSGRRFLAGRDWYRLGCKYLVAKQDAVDGAWRSRGRSSISYEFDLVQSSFALLFLSKGRTPVLISKMVHGNSFPRSERDKDWDQRPDDLRNLTKFVSKNVFNGTRLAWQAFDIRRANTDQYRRGDRGIAPVADLVYQRLTGYFDQPGFEQRKDGHQEVRREWRIHRSVPQRQRPHFSKRYW